MNHPVEHQAIIKTQESTEEEKELATDTPCLKNLFPEDERDLDALFPEPEVKQLFFDVAANLKRVNRFITRIEKDRSNSGVKNDKRRLG